MGEVRRGWPAPANGHAAHGQRPSLARDPQGIRWVGDGRKEGSPRQRTLPSHNPYMKSVSTAFLRVPPKAPPRSTHPKTLKSLFFPAADQGPAAVPSSMEHPLSILDPYRPPCQYLPPDPYRPPEQRPIPVLPKDRPAPIPPRHDVVKGARILNAQTASHPRSVVAPRAFVKNCLLTPFCPSAL